MSTNLADAPADAAADVTGEPSAETDAVASGTAQGDSAAQAPESPASRGNRAEQSREDILAALRELEQEGLPEGESGEAAGDGDTEFSQDEQGDETVEAASESEQDPAAEAAEPGDDEPGGLPRRIQIKSFSDRDRVILVAAEEMVHKNPGMSLAEALLKVGLDIQSALPADAGAKPKDEAPANTEAPSPLKELTQQVAELRKQRAEAQGRFDFEAASAIEEKLDDAKAQLLELTMAAKAEQRQQETALEQKTAAEFGRLGEIVTDYTTPGTPLNEAANRIWDEFQKANPALTKSEAWPKRLLALAWAEAHPDKPMPALVKAAAAAAPAVTAAAAVRKPAVPAQPVKRNVVPAKPGKAVAMLATGNGAKDGGDVFARARRPDATREDILRAIELVERG